MITLKNVSKWYGHFQVLTDCSTEVKKGEVVVVCGPSGSGKSTLIKTVNGLEPVQQGEITVDGIVVNDKKTDLAKLRSRVGMVFQHFELFPHLSIIENLTLAQVKVLKRDKAPAREKALKLLERVGLSAHPLEAIVTRMLLTKVKLEPEDEDVDEPTPENHEEKNDEGEKPQSITSIIKISLTVLVIGYALGKIAMLFS